MLIISTLSLLLMTIVVSHGFIFNIIKMKFFLFSRFFHAHIYTQFYANIKILHSNNGGEYVSHSFQEFVQTNDIISQQSCPSTRNKTG